MWQCIYCVILMVCCNTLFSSQALYALDRISRHSHCQLVRINTSQTTSALSAEQEEENKASCVVCTNDINNERPSAVLGPCQPHGAQKTHHVCNQCFDAGYLEGRLRASDQLRCPVCNQLYGVQNLALKHLTPELLASLNQTMQEEYLKNKKAHVLEVQGQEVIIPAEQLMSPSHLIAPGLVLLCALGIPKILARFESFLVHYR